MAGATTRGVRYCHASNVMTGIGTTDLDNCTVQLNYGGREMTGGYRHSWDRLKPDHDPRQDAAVTTPRQVLTGLPIGLANLRAYYTGCNRTLREGDRIWVHAYRAAEDAEWTITRCFCADRVERRIDTPTLGTSEVVAAARLNVRSLAGEQRHELCLTTVEPCAFSPLGEGTSYE